MQRKEDRRTKIVSIASGTLMVYRLPLSLDIDSLHVETGVNREILLSNGHGFEMDLTDWHHATK